MTARPPPRLAESIAAGWASPHAEVWSNTASTPAGHRLWCWRAGRRSPVLGRQHPRLCVDWGESGRIGRTVRSSCGVQAGSRHGGDQRPPRPDGTSANGFSWRTWLVLVRSPHDPPELVEVLTCSSPFYGTRRQGPIGGHGGRNQYIATTAPSAERWREISSPSPRLAPVTIARRPRRPKSTWAPSQ